MHPTSKFYNYLVSYTINVLALQLSTILYYQFRRFTTLYFLIQSTSTFYNSLLSYTTNFDVLQLPTILYTHVNVFQLSSILYNKPPSFTTLYYLILSISTIYNSLLSYTIQSSTFYNSLLSYTIQLRRFTTLYYLIQ